MKKDAQRQHDLPGGKRPLFMCCCFVERTRLIAHSGSTKLALAVKSLHVVVANRGGLSNSPSAALSFDQAPLHVYFVMIRLFESCCRSALREA